MADPRPGSSGPIAESVRLREQMLKAATSLELFSEQLLAEVERLREAAAPFLATGPEENDEH